MQYRRFFRELRRVVVILDREDEQYRSQVLRNLGKRLKSTAEDVLSDVHGIPVRITDVPKICIAIPKLSSIWLLWVTGMVAEQDVSVREVLAGRLRECLSEFVLGQLRDRHSNSEPESEAELKLEVNTRSLKKEEDNFDVGLSGT